MSHDTLNNPIVYRYKMNFKEVVHSYICGLIFQHKMILEIASTSYDTIIERIKVF